jgi:glutamate formiminotransferase
MKKIFEAVPNISEGRDQQKLNLFKNIVEKTPQVKVLDLSADPDHHRAVLTFIGTAEGIRAASFNLLIKAREVLDIRVHEGIHPRVGIIDVLPIIPVLNATMSDAVALARKIGEEIESRFKIPVYYYAEATKDEKFRILANIRREKYNIKQERTAGAVCVGARDFLVAYNINLKTQDVAIAKKIASLVREKNKDIKTLGLYLAAKKCAQVSMNLVNPLKTDRNAAYKLVEAETKKLGVEIKEEELIGLEPHLVQKAARQFADERTENGSIEKS